MGVGAAASEPGTLSLHPARLPGAEGAGACPRRVGRGLGARPRARSGDRRRPDRRCGRLAQHLLVQPRPRRAVARRRRRHAHREQATPRGGSSTCPAWSPAPARSLAATFAVIEGENRGYGTWWIVLLFAVAAVLVAAFVLIERRSPDPVLKLELFHNPTFTASNVVAFAVEPLRLLGLLLHRALPAADHELLGQPDRARVYVAGGRDDRRRARSPAAGRRGSGRRCRWSSAVLLAGDRAAARRPAAHGDDERRGARVAARDRRDRLRDRARDDDASGARDRPGPSSRAWRLRP